MSLSRPSFHSAVLPALAAYAMAFAALLAGGLIGADGHLIYGLDDAYIHLAMAEEIAHGGYGINPGEFAPAASSILYPLLLTPFAHTWLQGYLPLLWGTLGGAVSVALLVAVLSDALGPRRGLVTLLAMALALGFNLPGLPLLGMEHSLQIAAALAVIWGMTRMAGPANLPRWAMVAIVVGPLLRYENIPLSLAAIACIAWLGRPRLAGALLVAMALPLLGFSAFLYLNAQQVLPNPILLKAGLIDIGLHDRLIAWLVGMRRGAVIFPALLAVALLVSLWRSPMARAHKAVGIVALAALLGQIAGGGWDVLGRYASYATISGVVALLWLQHALVLGAAQRFGTLGLGVLVALGLAAATPATMLALFSMPQAQRNVYQQQYQLHRLAADFINAPVAVNDIGLVSWRNQRYVLDMTGIAQKRLAPGDFDSSAVVAALIYEGWFAPLPPGWVKLGELGLSGPNVNLGGATVAIFATRPQEAQRLRTILQAWTATLPDGIRYRAF